MAQYTIRKVPDVIDKALRDRARREGKSLNDAAIEALKAGVGLADAQVEFHDMDDLIGTWEHDADTQRALVEQDVVDADQWR